MSSIVVVSVSGKGEKKRTHGLCAEEALQKGEGAFNCVYAGACVTTSPRVFTEDSSLCSPQSLIGVFANPICSFNVAGAEQKDASAESAHVCG